MEESKQSQHIIFPSNSGSIIREIMIKHLIQENEEEFLKKIRKQQITLREIILRTVREVAESHSTDQTFSLKLQKGLKIEGKKAQQLAQDLKEHIILKASQNHQQQKDKENNESLVNGSNNKRKSSDLYREDIG